MEQSYLVLVSLALILSLGKHVVDAIKLSKYKQVNQSQNIFIDNAMEAFALHELIVDENKVPIDYRFLRVNQAFEEMTGLKKEIVEGSKVLDLMPRTERYWIELYGRVVLEQVRVRETLYSKELNKYFEISAYPKGR
jgi:PAS domain-containing protein